MHLSLTLRPHPYFYVIICKSTLYKIRTRPYFDIITYIGI